MATQTKARFFAPHETELDAEERMSRDELEALQLTRLQWTVRHAYENDMIILRGVNLLPTQIEEIALGIDALSPHFLLELSRRGRMDDLLVRIEPRPDADAAARERAAAILADRIKVQIGTTVRVQLDEPGALERSAGELKRPYDLR
jgi:phenylacetate-coenzyme A ligase PaaK-like adenylate-forming protein